MNDVEKYKNQVKDLNERLKSKDLTLKEYTTLLKVIREVLIDSIEKNNKIQVF